MLEWVVHNDEVVHVRVFAELPPRSRPRVTCPACGGDVRPHLGRKVRHHAAHRADSHCSAAQGESALHLNIKLHLAKELRDAPVERRTLIVSESCEARGCDARDIRPWMSAWDEVFVETRVADESGSRVPDILLKQHGRALGAIEVYASNAVSSLKASALARFGVPFIEVKAEEALIADGASWSVESPLPVVRESERVRWRCERHLRDTTQRQLYAVRVVDLLFESGRSLRRVYEIEVVYRDGIAVGAELRCEADIVSRAPIPDGANRDARKHAVDALVDAYERDVASFRDNRGAIVDSPMPWTTGTAARSIMLDLASSAQRRRLFLFSRYPRRYRYVRSRNAWWIPPDMRDVTWNREEVSPFEEHPIWGKVKEESRQRYLRHRSDNSNEQT